MAIKNKVRFKWGTQAQYDALETKDDLSLYFLLDTHQLYKGAARIGSNYYYNGNATGDIDLDAQEALGDGETPILNDLLTLTDSNGLSDLYVYTTNGWTKINENLRINAEAIEFQDGDTLTEKLANLQPNIQTDEKSISFVNSVLSLNDYGKVYYRYVEHPAVGIEGDPDYVAAYSEYVRTVVSQEHPWKAGLVPRVNDNGELGWYEEHLETLEGVSATIQSLRDTIDRIDSLNQQQETIIGNLQEELEKVDGLIEVVGTMGDEETPSTGLIQRVENLEDTAITSVSLNGTELTAVNGAIDIPVFDGANEGIVPAFTPVDGSVDPAEFFLNAEGDWINPIGDMSIGSTIYTTVVEYVDAKVEAEALRWEPIKES